MIRVIVECWPMGDESRKRVIATGDIVNMGGDLDIADYRSSWKVPDRDIKRKGHVLRFPRLRRSVLELVAYAILNAFGE